MTQILVRAVPKARINHRIRQISPANQNFHLITKVIVNIKKFDEKCRNGIRRNLYPIFEKYSQKKRKHPEREGIDYYIEPYASDRRLT